MPSSHDTPPTILEVWHGGIPNDSPRLTLCTAANCPEPGAHSHTQRISHAPYSIPWPLWITGHMSTPPAIVVHVVGHAAR